MTPKQITLIRKSFTPLAAQSRRAGAFFYDRLFALDPSLRPLFPYDLQNQGEKFIQTLGILIRTLEQDSEEISADFQQMGQRHKEYGVQRQHYETLREAFLWALAQILGEDFDDDVALAWCKLYNDAARAMRLTQPEMA